MTHLILLLNLFPGVGTLIARAPVQPCVWPNPCAAAPTAKADFEICVWPRKCSGKKAETAVLAQFQPCVWPNRCAKNAAV